MKRQREDTDYSMFNAEQGEFVSAVLKDIHAVVQDEAPTTRAYFLDGCGGTGKTTVYNYLIDYCDNHRIVSASSAWTGIAATLLTRGQTCHSLFKLAIPVEKSSVDLTDKVLKKFLRSVIVFIVDEASMIPTHALWVIDCLLRQATDVDIPFGGKVFILGGDFRQVLPVIRKGNRRVIVGNCLKNSVLWPEIRRYRLTRNMRARGDQEFAQWLLGIGNGSNSTIVLPPQINVVKGDIIDEVFTNLETSHSSAIVTPKNETCHRINTEVICRLPGRAMEYLSIDSSVEGVASDILNNLTPTGMPPHRLILKPGAIVMLTQNLCVSRGLCNGTRLIVRTLRKDELDAEIVTGVCAGERIFIVRIDVYRRDDESSINMKRRQFPLRLAYCMTINKSQGQTFDKVGIYLPNSVFTHGQLYVAFSRVRSFRDVYIQICGGSANTTRNIVFDEVL